MSKVTSTQLSQTRSIFLSVYCYRKTKLSHYAQVRVKRFLVCEFVKFGPGFTGMRTSPHSLVRRKFREVRVE